MHVKNPKTAAQTLQRVLVKVVALAYAMMKAICNHSFEGVTNGFQCMNKFKKVNLRYLRERAATLQSLGQSLNQFYQFMPLQGEKWSPFAAIISMGHLPEVSVGIDAEGGHKAYVNTPSRTYADFVNSWGLQRGDQVTFVTVQKRQGKYEVNYARLILNPRNADGSGAPMTTEIVDSQGEFPCSNWKNQLNFSSFEFDTDHFNFVLGRGGDVVAAGIIVSRKDKSGGWFRSNCQLVLNEAGLGSDLCSLAEAVDKQQCRLRGYWRYWRRHSQWWRWRRDTRSAQLQHHSHHQRCKPEYFRRQRHCHGTHHQRSRQRQQSGRCGIHGQGGWYWRCHQPHQPRCQRCLVHGSERSSWPSSHGLSWRQPLVYHHRSRSQ